MGSFQFVPQRKFLLGFVVLGSLIWVLSSLARMNTGQQELSGIRDVFCEFVSGGW